MSRQLNVSNPIVFDDGTVQPEFRDYLYLLRDSIPTGSGEGNALTLNGESGSYYLDPVNMSAGALPLPITITTAQISDLPAYQPLSSVLTNTTASFTTAYELDLAANTAARHDAVTVQDTAEIDLTLTGQQISGDLISSSIASTKLDSGVNASLTLANTAMQDVVDDATPTLGGDLNADRKVITSIGRTEAVGESATVADATATPIHEISGTTSHTYTGGFGAVAAPALKVSATYEMDKVSLFGGGFLFWNLGTLSHTANHTLAGSFYTLVNQLTNQADAATITQVAQIDVWQNPIHKAINGGSLTVTAYYCYIAEGRVDSGATVTSRYAYCAKKPTLSGTGAITREVGFACDEQDVATHGTNFLSGTITIPDGYWCFYQDDERPNRWNGPQQYKLDTKTAAATLDSTEHVIRFTSGTGNATLPAAATANTGREYVIRNDRGTSVTVAATGGDTITGTTSIATASYARYVSDGVSDWFQTG